MPSRVASRPELGAVAVLLAVVVATACGSEALPSVDDRPWDEPVAGAVAITEWQDDGQPVAPFGPGGAPWGSPEELIAAMTQALASSGDIRTTGRVVERNGSGTVVGWVRMEVEDGAVLAGELRVEMRNDAGPWAVVNIRSREHCAQDLVDGTCP